MEWDHEHSGEWAHKCHEVSPLLWPPSRVLAGGGAPWVYLVRDFLSHSLIRQSNRRRWKRQREKTAAQRRGRLGGAVYAHMIRESVRLRCGGEVWRPWRAS